MQRRIAVNLLSNTTNTLRIESLKKAVTSEAMKGERLTAKQRRRDVKPTILVIWSFAVHSL